MLLRSHVVVLCLVEEKKVIWDLFFVKSENFLWDICEICEKNKKNDYKNGLHFSKGGVY